MRKVLIEKEVFKFEELSKNAQNKIIENERVCWQDDFELCVQDFLETKFPNSELKFQYSLSCCQGDGFNFYGKIDVLDVVSKMKFNEEEEKIFNEIDGYFANSIKKLSNCLYCYSLTNRDNFGFGEILKDIEWDFNQNQKPFDFEFKVYENLIKKMKETLREFFNNAEKNFENLRYDIIYPSIESCIADGIFDDYEYFENGDIFEEGEVGYCEIFNGF